MPVSQVKQERRDALLAQGLKECSPTSGCGKAKRLDEFHKSSRNSDGRQSRCAECLSEARKRCYDAAPEKSAEYGRAYREANREAVREYNAGYRRDNPLLERLRRGKNRARVAGVPFDDVTVDQLLADWERRGISPDHDAYTGDPLEPGFHLDHVSPLSVPGTPGHVVSNLVPCNPTTNIEKSQRGLVEFLADRAEVAKELTTV